MAEIPGLVVLYSNVHRIDLRKEEDPQTYPWKIYCNFDHPDFMRVTSVMLFGGSTEFIICAKTREALEECCKQNEWATDPKLRRVILTHPDGKEELLLGKWLPSHGPMRLLC